VTRFVREHVREPYVDHEHLWFLLAIARTFNWPPTIARILGLAVRPNGRFTWSEGTRAVIVGHLDSLVTDGHKVYTGAYMIRAESDPKSEYYAWSKQKYIVDVVLGALWEERHNFMLYFDNRRVRQPTLQEVWKWFLPFRGWGPFMAYEVVTDLRHTRYLAKAEDITTWANAGPGALRGLNRLLRRHHNERLDPEEATVMMYELQQVARNATGVECPLDPEVFGMHPGIEMRDIEHSLCETDKYLRVARGEGRPRQKYQPPETGR
jgi:hypothetical protein